MEGWSCSPFVYDGKDDEGEGEEEKRRREKGRRRKIE